MTLLSITEALKDSRFVLSELGDGTAVLTSLTGSRIISLNRLGTDVVRALIDAPSSKPSEDIDDLVATLAAKYELPNEKVRADIDSFLDLLGKELGSLGR